MQGFVDFNESAEHYNSGFSASKSGKSRQDNPYKEGSLAAKYWAKGYEHHKTGKPAEKFTEETDKDLPFTPDAKVKKVATPGKYGSAYSTARYLARKALEKQAKKNVKEEGGKICVDEETLIEKLDKKQELRAALDRHTQKAIEANRRGDDEAVKTHQTYINKIKDKMTKIVRNEEVELEEEQLDELNKGYAPGWMLKADPELAKKVKDKTQGYKDLKKYAGRDIPKKEEAQLEESSDAHKVMVTVSDPNHPAVSQRKEQIMKHVIVRAGDKGDAQAKAEAFYKKKGYKVHGSEYHSKQPATSVKTEEKEMENMKTFTQFMEELEEIQESDYGWDVPEKKEKPVSNVRKIAGKAYGGAAQKDDEDEDHPVANKATEKRGRGRPKGSTSGARTAGAAKKSYGGLAFHTLSLPKTNK